MASVELRNVSKQYPGGVTAVDDLSLEVNDREFLVLVGPSGCGKSTTLRMIAGLEEVSRGEICIDGRNVTHVVPKDRNIAMVFQNYALYPHMTAERNMAFGLELRYGGWFRRIWKRLTSPEEAKALAQQQRQIPNRVRQAAQLLGIEHLLRRMPRQLSGGERQRVALGRAIVREPAAFLFDEPLSNLDARLRVEMRRELKQLHQRLGATMIYVTHDQVEAMTLGERIVVMDGGRIQQIGPPMEVYERPRNRFVAGFLGSPPMNFIAGRVVQNQDKTKATFTGGGLEIELPGSGAFVGREVVLGVRPEDAKTRVELSPGEHEPAHGTVAVVESLGDQAIVHVQLNRKPGGAAESTENVTCKSPVREAPPVGQAVRLELDTQRVHLFDLQTGANLAWEKK